MSAGRLNRLYDEYGSRVQFFVVYIAEAHAMDSRAPFIARSAPLVQEPVTTEERMALCGKCVTAMAIKRITALVDRIDDQVNAAYGAWPDRLFLVGTDGRIAYRGGRGPFGFKTGELEAAIRKELGLPAGKEAGSPPASF